MKATRHGEWSFSEPEWAAIDKAVRNVYFKNRTRLPAHWQGGPTDPAGELRSWAYEYAATHAEDIHDRAHTPPFITKHLAGRMQQFLNRSIEKYEELPYSVGHDFNERVTKAVGGYWEPVAAPAERDPYEDALEPYKRLLTPRRRQRLWELMNPGDYPPRTRRRPGPRSSLGREHSAGPSSVPLLDPTGDTATENIYLEHLQHILDTQLFHPGRHCKCKECVNIIEIAA
ncbi:hypothetical protein ABZ546_01485 [Brachybacterium paraconglomeratum]